MNSGGLNTQKLISVSCHIFKTGQRQALPTKSQQISPTRDTDISTRGFQSLLQEKKRETGELPREVFTASS